MQEKTLKIPLSKRLHWFFRKHFGHSNAVRTYLSITGLLGFALILLMAAGSPLLWLVIFGVAAVIGASFTVVSGIKAFWDYVAERHQEVTDQTLLESLQFALYAWLKQHRIASTVGTLFVMLTILLILIAVFSPATLLGMPFVGIAIHFVATGLAGVSASVALPLATFLMGVAAVILWDGLCRIVNAIFFPEDESRKVSTYRLSAEDGDPEAQFKLALNYEKIQSKSLHLNQAAHYYALAANQGHIPAQLKLKAMSKNTRYQYAADQGDREAQFKLAQWYKSQCKFMGLRDPNAKEQEFAKQAMYYYQLAARQGHARANLYLGEFYFLGVAGVIKKEPEKGFKCYCEAAKLGNEEAEFLIADCYYHGWGVKENREKAAHYYQILAQRGFDQAQYKLGYCYYKGEGVAKNRDEALKWFIAFGKAQSEGNTIDMALDKLLKEDASLALAYYTSLAEEGFAVPQYELGLLYYHSAEDHKNYDTAVGLFNLAARSDIDYVKAGLSALYEKDQKLKEALQRLQPQRMMSDEDTSEESETESTHSTNLWQLETPQYHSKTLSREATDDEYDAKEELSAKEPLVKTPSRRKN